MSQKVSKLSFRGSFMPFHGALVTFEPHNYVVAITV